MAKERSFKNPHYLGLIIEKEIWNKLKIKAWSTDDSVSKLVRNTLNELVKDIDKIS